MIAQESNNPLKTALELNQGTEFDEKQLELIAEVLVHLTDNPIKINFATRDDLAQIPYLNIFQISNLLLYREQAGLIYTPFELMAVKGFDRPLIEILVPLLDFTCVNPSPRISWEDLSRSRHEIIFRYEQTLQSRLGFRLDARDGYLGSSFASYVRYRGKVRDIIHIGLSAQKDAGEPLNSKTNPLLADHISAFVALKKIGVMEYLVLGDYQMSLSQGLILWNSGGLNGPGRFTQVKRYGRGINAYAGAEEVRFFRGSAIQLKFSPLLNMQLFFSSKALNASVTRDSLGAVREIGRLINTGFHRTEKEIEGKGTNQLKCWGGQLQWGWDKLRIAANTVHYRFAFPVTQASSLYNQYRFNGSRLSNYSVEANLLWHKYNFFSELAIDQGGHFASVAGMESLLTDGFYLSLGTRFSQLEYQHFYTAIPSATSASGERGVFIGLSWEINPKLQLSLSTDYFQIPWLGYRTGAPSGGNATSVQIQIPLKRSFNITVMARSRNDYQNAEATDVLQKLIPRKRTNLRAELYYQFHSHFGAAWRIEKSIVHDGSRTKGLLLYQDLNMKFAHGKIDVKARIALIDAPDYASRIYAYEPDLLYKFNIPAHYGQAFRAYLMLKWGIISSISLQVKLGVTTFRDREYIGSGLQQIEGRNMSNLAIQLRVKV